MGKNVIWKTQPACLSLLGKWQVVGRQDLREESYVVAHLLIRAVAELERMLKEAMFPKAALRHMGNLAD